ncbi:MAG TPA: carboxypeptidase-like regulatory domain-containing protein [Chitinophagales bacterium]|nr:carboxypeptidase-like regulatory domain-containing protein [Chitinophagales bacterium]
MKKALILLSALICLFISSCEKGGSIKVTVQRPSMQPVPYATMIVEKLPDITRVSAAEANSLGQAVISDLKPGDYRVTAENFDSIFPITGSADVSVKSGENTDVTVTIQ